MTYPNETYGLLKEKYGFTNEFLYMCHDIEQDLQPIFKNIDDIAEFNQLKVLLAMQENRLSDIHFAGTTGYGYHDIGRDVVETIYAHVFKAESALVRPQLISGTHALYVALSSQLKPGDELLSPVGIPYNTLQGVIGIRPCKGSLMEMGIHYKQVDLLEGGHINWESIKKSISPKTKMVTLQRSKGYEWRKSFTVAEIGEIIQFIKSIRSDIICMVDNCYGEFTQTIEPIEVGADLVVGSLIKNPGGGLAPVGGYIVGKEEYVENAAFRLSAPGLGKEVGPSLGLTTSFLQGLFLAPHIVAGSLKGAVFASKLMEKMGYLTNPLPDEVRGDIVQGIQLKDRDTLLRFCEGIQKAAPVDSFVVPEPWDMPGYDCPVIMAAGTFISGASIELSADAPVKPPFNVYLQGGLTWEHAKLGIMIGAFQLQKYR